MDFSSIEFLLVIVLVGGVAGYVGDNLGKKLGKKRLSLLGLRPRHTAAVSTVAFGMFLSLLTIALVLVISAPVRRWILHGSQALADLNQIRRQLDEEQPRLARAKADYERTSRQEKALQVDLEADRRTVQAQHAQIRAQKIDISKFEHTISRIKAEIASKDMRLALNERSLKAESSKLQAVNEQFKQVKQGYKETKIEADKIFLANDELERQNRKLSKSIEVQKASLLSIGAQKEELELTRRNLAAEVEHDRADLAALSSDLRHMEVALSDVKGKLVTAQDTAAHTDEINSYLRQDFIHTRTQPLIYSRFEEVARLSVDADLTSEQASKAIDTLIDRAQFEAKKRGASAQGAFKVADIIDRPDGTTAEQIKKLLHDKLVGNPEPLALIALSSFNFYQREPVAIDVSVKPNPIVYHRGEVVDQTNLNGASSDSDILKALTTFGVALKEKAQHDQMIPQPNGETFGSVPADQVFNLVSGVKQAGRRVRLFAIVQSDTHAADPLRLDFRIR